MARTGDKHELLETLNNIWDLIPYDNKPTYGEFNHLTPMGEDKIPKLRELEQKDPSVGIARFGTSQEGVSVLSIIATITEKGFGDRLAVDIEEAPDGDISINDLKIMGFRWYYEENPDEDRDLTSADVKK